MNLPHFPSIPYWIFCQELWKVCIVGKGRTKAGATMTAQGSVPRDFPLYNFLRADKVQQNKKKKKKSLGKKASLSSLVHVQSKRVKPGLGNEGLLQPPFPLPFIANYLKFNLITTSVKRLVLQLSQTSQCGKKST